MTDIQTWLRRNGFERFADLFEANEIDFDALSELNDEHLKELGIPLGPRVKLLKAINALGSSDAASPVAADPSPAVSPAASHEAERRQLTVMFVDLVGSTALSGRLDPEVMREVMTAYQNTVAGVVTRFEGHVAKYMGDGVLCYFGWPRAHEDDAERAVRAGLAVMQSMAGLKQPDGEALAARGGIATGVVVVGDLIGEGAAQEEAVVGETPNLAARVQELAEPGQLVVAEPTRHLLGDVFEVAHLGDHELKGISGKTSTYAVTAERTVESRFEARSSGVVSEMVGRDQELALMLERWKQAKQSEGQLVLLSGEAGIGKSRISRAMVDTVADQPHIRLSYQCSPYHTDSALYPAIQQLTFAAGIKATDRDDEKLDKLEVLLSGSDTALLAALLGLETEQRYGPLDMTPQRQRARTLQALVDQLIALSQQKSVLFVLEDAHWIDATTLELVDLCLDQVAGARVMMLITARPTFEHGFGGHPIVTKLALNRLGREQVNAIVGKLTGGKALPGEVLDEIAGKTDGVPLFVEELTKAVMESGELEETADAFELTGPLSRLAIPATLHDSLMARLDRLHSVKELAQTAACIGREFDYPLIDSISPFDGAALEEALDQLVAAELIFRRGVAPEATYIFKHALVRDAAYESLLKSRRQTIHEELLDVLEAREDVAPELLAHHFTEAGQAEQAVDHWYKAAQQALQRSANLEAVGHLRKELEVLMTLPESAERDRKELTLQTSLGPALMATKGYAAPEVGKAYARARELCEQVGETEELFTALWGVWLYHVARAEHHTALELAERLGGLAERLSDTSYLLEMRLALGVSYLYLGDLRSSRKHLEESVHLYDPERHVALGLNYGGLNPGVGSLAYLAWTLWLLGDVEQAVARADQAQALIRRLDTAYTRARLFYWDAIVRQFVGDWQAVRANAEEAIAITTEQNIALVQAVGPILLGWALVREGQEVDGARKIRQGVGAYRDTGAVFQLPHLMVPLAEAARALGRPEEGLDVLTEAMAIVESTGERYFEAELHRLQGELLLDRSPADHESAESAFQKALSVARAQQAKSLELRAATSLARLWKAQAKTAAARDLLAPVYDWFTEGLDTPDLKDAKALLDRLG